MRDVILPRKVMRIGNAKDIKNIKRFVVRFRRRKSCVEDYVGKETVFQTLQQQFSLPKVEIRER